MKALIIVGLLVWCGGIEGGYQQRQEEDVQAFKVGDPCQYDEDCHEILNAYCWRNRACQCKIGFVQTDMGTCQPTIGASCRVTTDCDGIDNAECTQRTCACQEEFVPFPDGQTCRKKAQKLLDACVETLECIDFENSVCRDGICICDEGYHNVSANIERPKPACLSNKGYGNACKEHDECYINAANENRMECRGTDETDISKVCRCRVDYRWDGRTCTLGAASISISALCLLFGVMTFWFSSS